jgi:hypothetical protein
MTKLRLAAFASVALLASSTAGAAPLVGSFTTIGLGDVRIGPNGVDWGQSGGTFGSGSGDLMFVSGTGDFNMLGMTSGTIKELNTAVDPIGSNFLLDHFITSTAAPAWDFALTFIQPGTGKDADCTAAAGAVCTPLGSPFTITNLVGGGATLAFEVNGWVSDGAGPSTAFVGTFTTTYSDMNAAEILAQFVSQGYVQSSHSGQFSITGSTPDVPEPTSLLLLGSGLLSATFLRRRRSNGSSGAV